jgi:hypothetical protein
MDDNLIWSSYPKFKAGFSAKIKTFCKIDAPGNTDEREFQISYPQDYCASSPFTY